MVPSTLLPFSFSFFLTLYPLISFLVEREKLYLSPSTGRASFSFLFRRAYTESATNGGFPSISFDPLFIDEMKSISDRSNLTYLNEVKIRFGLLLTAQVPL